MVFRVIILFIIAARPVLLSPTTAPTTSRPTSPPPKPCGYKSCHPVKDGYINVHLVPHTHDDVGWLKTVDQYYYGSRSKTQLAGVQYILDSVIEALKKDPNRRFIYVETSFFWKWWMKQHDMVKHQVKRMVNNGQLEFIGGAWSMNDEADTHYHSIIDQFTWGSRKLNDTFGECGRPKIGWQIDPFGHSSEMASIFAQLGYDGLLLGRIDYQDKSFRLKTKSAEIVWQGNPTLGANSNIFTGVMYNTYSPPPGFCFDILCVDDPLIDDKKSTEYNIDEKLEKFIEYLDKQSLRYQTNNLIVTMGGDFTYMDAEMWYSNLDKLIRYVNERQASGSKYNLIYSTPSCYVKAVHDEAVSKGKKWLMKSDDFFPYASDPHAYWTGYFTSKPTIKRFERLGNNYLQVCKQLYALTDLGPEDRVDLNVMREAMGVLQHHDAITGTEKEHVAHDYARILQNGFDECDIITSTALNKLMQQESKNNEDPPVPPTVPFSSCLLTNMSSCPFTEQKENFVVTLYNPLSKFVSKYVRLPVNAKSYTVKDPDGNEILLELIPIHDAIIKMPGRKSKATVEIVFYASDIPPLGYKSYYVSSSGGDKRITESPEGEHHQLGASDISFDIDTRTGLITKVSMNGMDSIPLSQNFLYYQGFVGDNKKFENRSSGAYIFRPLEQDATPVAPKAQIKIYRGQIVSEVQQTFNEWTSQTMRIYHEENFIEFDWIVGPIPNDTIGREVISRFTTDLKTNAIFYTDSNGRQSLKRMKNFRPTWKLEIEEPVAGNYYPVTSKISMRDTERNIQVTVLTDRAQGGSSLKDGEIELMVHRLCKHDDAFGVDEALIEEAFGTTLVVRGSHYLIAGPIGNDLTSVEQDVAQRKLLDAWTFLSPTSNLSFEKYQSKHKMQFSGLTSPLPDALNIFTLEPWIGFSFLLRIENVIEIPGPNSSIVINLKDIFAPFKITGYRETTLGGNQWHENNHRLNFETGDNIETLLDEDDSSNKSESLDAQRRTYYRYLKTEEDNFVKREIFTVTSELDDFQISLKPMQIRTFVIDVDFGD